MTDTAKLRKTISEILDEADLNTITAKKVRQQLEATLKTDLTERKKEIDEMVMEIMEEKQDAKSGSEEEDEASEDDKKKSKGRGGGGRKRAADSGSEDDYVPEKKPAKGKKRAADSDDNSSGDDWSKKSKKASGGKAASGGAKKKGGGGGTGFTKTLKLSPALSKVMGVEEMARHEVVKKVWSIIKEKNLYDPKNKQFAICNSELLPVFGVKRFRTFGMMKYLKDHFIG